MVSDPEIGTRFQMLSPFLNERTRRSRHRSRRRNAQFERINVKVRAGLKAGEPVISGDAKKELVGDLHHLPEESEVGE